MLSIQEVADRLSVSTRTVYNLIYAGKLHACKISRRCVRISEDELNAFIQTATETAAR